MDSMSVFGRFILQDTNCMAHFAQIDGVVQW